MSVPQQEPSWPAHKEPSERKRRRLTHTERIQLRCSPATKARLAEAARSMLMSRSEFIEYFLERFDKGLVVFMEPGHFLSALMKTVEDRAGQVSAQVSEETVYKLLYDKGLVGSPRPE